MHICREHDNVLQNLCCHKTQKECIIRPRFDALGKVDVCMIQSKKKLLGGFLGWTFTPCLHGRVCNLVHIPTCSYVLFHHAHCPCSSSTAHSSRRSPDIMWTNAIHLYISSMNVSFKMSSIICLCWKRHPKVLKQQKTKRVSTMWIITHFENLPFSTVPISGWILVQVHTDLVSVT